MTSKLFRFCALAVVGGTVFHTLSCLSLKPLYGVAQFVLPSVLTEFLIDNDGVFDLFQDDFGTGTTYDDRGTADATRDEPDAEG